MAAGFQKTVSAAASTSGTRVHDIWIIELLARLGHQPEVSDAHLRTPCPRTHPSRIDLLASRSANVILVDAQRVSARGCVSTYIAHQAVIAGHSEKFTGARQPAAADLNGLETDCRALDWRAPFLHAPRTARHGRARLSRNYEDLFTYNGFQLVMPPLRAPLPAHHHQPRLQSHWRRPSWQKPPVQSHSSTAITHQVEVLLIEGQSYRRREAEIRHSKHVAARNGRSRL